MRWRSQALLGLLGMVTAMSGFWSEGWALPPEAERGPVGREVVRILLSQVQVAEMKLEQVRLEVVRFFGDGRKRPAVLLRGEGMVRAGAKEDRVLLEGDSGSACSGQWRRLSRGEVLQVPVKVVLEGRAVSGALVVWQRPGGSEGRFVSDEAVGDARNPMLAPGLAAPQPNLPSSEYIVDFYADLNFTEWVGSFIRLCNGATSREGIQDGFSKAETTTSCDVNNPWSHLECWQYIGWDENGDGKPEQFAWFQVNCPPRFPW